MSADTWFAFFAAAWAIALSPGAGAVAAMSSGLQHGLSRGYWTVIGLQIGIILQLCIVSAGVGALLSASSAGFEIVRWFGVAYLCWLGIQQWRARPGEMPTVAVSDRTSASAMIVRGFLVNASNPKATVFMLAILPQFLDPARPLTVQYLVMGVTLVSVDLVVMAGYTGLGARGLRLLNSSGQQRIICRVFGTLFIAAAMVLAAFRRAA